MNIYKKLLDVKRKVPYLKKDKKGFNYTYVTPSQVFATVNPLLNNVGLLLVTHVTESKSYPIEISTKNGPKTEWKYDLDLMFDWVDTEDGEKVTIAWKASGVNGEDKGLGSALTYAERYFILKQFNIPTDDDDPDNFQDKYLTGDEKQQKKEAEKRESEKQQTQQSEMRQRELNASISKLASCQTVEDLKALKVTLSDWVKKDKSFENAATERFLQITSVKKEPQPA